MQKNLWRTALAWLLAIFFVIGGMTNILASDTIRADYLEWGYPDWFHYVTGTLELATAVLLVFPATRLAGSALGSLVMVAATGTVVMNNEYVHALMPLATLAVLVLNALATALARRATATGRQAGEARRGVP